MRSDVCNSNKPVKPLRRKGHMCGLCFTPHANEGNKDCPNRDENKRQPKKHAAQISPYLQEGDGRPDGRTTEDVEADEVLAWNESQHIDCLVDGGREDW